MNKLKKSKGGFLGGNFRAFLSVLSAVKLKEIFHFQQVEMVVAIGKKELSCPKIIIQDSKNTLLKKTVYQNDLVCSFLF